MSEWKILHGDVRKQLKGLPGDHFDAVLSDPPYAYKFMGQRWDYNLPSVNVWVELLRVMKPGAHVMLFGGPRTFHRLVCAVEDAGFIPLDLLMYLHAKGFPKSHDIAKAIDKAAGNWRGRAGKQKSGNPALGGPNLERTPKGEPSTEAGVQWKGYGTALKPAWESILMAEKPLEIGGLCGIVAQRIQEAVCRLRLCVRVARKGSSSRRADYIAVSPDSALWDAVEGCSTPGALLALMATWPSVSEIPSSLSIALSWLSCLAEASDLASTFTIETASSLTIDLRTLRSSLSKLTPHTIIEVATRIPGMTSDALLVGALFGAVASRLAIIRTSSAGGSAISPVGDAGFDPDVEPILLAMKNLDGTFAENVQKWGTGALAIDAGRIGAEGGRWPANVAFDDEAAEMLDLQSGTTRSNKRPPTGKDERGTPGFVVRRKDTQERGHEDEGGASRFFFTSKVSRGEREHGCDDMTETETETGALSHYNDARRRTPKLKNTHPTLKAIELTRWLATLLLPPVLPGRTRRILVPFSGAGSEMIGCLQAGWDEVIGIEGEANYIEIAKNRITKGGVFSGLLDKRMRAGRQAGRQAGSSTDGS